MRKAVYCVVVLSVLLGMCTSCASKPVGNAEICIGFNVELTGALAQYGQNCMDGANLAIEHINQGGGINGRLLKAVVLDNRSESADAALAAIRLGETNGVRAIVGPTNSNLVKSALSANNVTPMIIPSATANALLPAYAENNNLYRICYTDTVQGNAIARFAYDRGFRNVVVLTESSSDYSRGMSDAFKGMFDSLGGGIISQEFYNMGEVDFYGILTKLSTKEFDSIFLPGYYIEAGLIIRQMNELGIDAAVLSGDAFDSPELEEIVGNADYLDDIFFTNHYLPNAPENEYFETEYIREYKTNPSAYAALGYDSVMIFAEAVKNSCELNEQSISQSLEQTENFSGVTGVITMDRNHNAQKEVYVTEISGGKRIKAGDAGGETE